MILKTICIIFVLAIIFILGTFGDSNKSNYSRSETPTLADITRRIRFGKVTTDKFPFLAYIFIGNITIGEQSSLDGFGCAGSLIKDQWILTAAHCFNSIRDDPDLKLYRVVAYFGDNHRPDLLTPSKLTGYTANAARYIVHDGYTSIPHNINDIALIKLEYPLPSDTASPVQLPQHPMADEVVNKRATIIGWGRTETNEKVQDLRVAEVTLSDHEICRKRNFICQVIEFEQSNENPFPKDISTTGEQDSGGPLLLKDNNNWMLIGVVSGQSILPTFPAVYLERYTDVSKYLCWISEQIRNN